MTCFYSVKLLLPEKLGETERSGIELVFSELLDTVSTSLERQNDGSWLLCALFDHKPYLSTLNDILFPALQKADSSLVNLKIEKLKERDWLAENISFFKPFEIGRFWIFGDHVKKIPAQWRIPLRMNAARAFGSGSHATTKGCLRAIQMIPGLKPQHILDLGCGSAILAIGAWRRWPMTKVVALDNDRVSVEVARANLRLNKVSPNSISIFVSDGFKNASLFHFSSFDLILANILARPLIQMSSEISTRLTSRGWIILSGVLKKQSVEVENAFRARGLRLWARLIDEDWVTLVMRPALIRPTFRIWRGG